VSADAAPTGHTVTNSQDAEAARTCQICGERYHTSDPEDDGRCTGCVGACRHTWDRHHADPFGRRGM
jgi:hypothetical protein